MLVALIVGIALVNFAIMVVGVTIKHGIGAGLFGLLWWAFGMTLVILFPLAFWL